MGKSAAIFGKVKICIALMYLFCAQSILANVLFKQNNSKWKILKLLPFNLHLITTLLILAKTCNYLPTLVTTCHLEIIEQIHLCSFLHLNTLLKQFTTLLVPSSCKKQGEVNFGNVNWTTIWKFEPWMFDIWPLSNKMALVICKWVFFLFWLFY